MKPPNRFQAKPVSGRGYAWLCDFGLCHWAEADMSVLLANGKPSPEAKAVPVRLILEKDFRRLKSANEQAHRLPLTAQVERKGKHE